MAQRAEDVLVNMLNIDGEIKIRMDRLAEMERGAEDCMAPWLNEARTVLRSDMALLRARREEHFLRLNALLASRPAR
jgi:hypothetical protein